MACIPLNHWNKHKVLISVPNKPIDSKNNRQVIYTSGLATTSDILSDKLLQVSEKAIQLNRKVEMYQWKENVETKMEKMWVARNRM